MMANLSEDIQCAGSDTRPPMLDRSDFESWQQCICLYCLGKDNGENILKSIDEGPFKMGKFRETLAEGALHLGPEHDRVFADLTPEEMKRFKADIRATNILLQGLPKDIYILINHYTDAKDIWDHVKMLLEGFELTNDEPNTFDDDVDEAPTAQTMFMANLSLADPIYDEVGPLYYSDILSEYVKENAVQVVQCNVSFVLNEALMMIINDMHEQSAQCVSANEQNKVVNESLTAELARYKEQVELYKKRARFELTEREQKIDEQLRIIITDRNIKEESLKKELHSIKMQLNFTIGYNKSMREEVATLKKDFKQKENKYLEDFLDMKALKEKKKVAIGYKSPLYLSRAKQVQPALYNGHELVKTNHTRVVVHDSEDTLDIAEKTRIGMLEKMKSTLWVDSKIKITPPDYSKENYLATFTPQRQLTPEQIFWSSDLEEITPKPISKMTVYSPNTPARLVPRVLPTKSQVKINIYTLI
ncbi:hypothetical protein Tco_0902954 [Tanacetum coccineum]